MSNFQMRPSRVLKRLRAGENVLSFKINLSCPRVVDIAGLAGYDCVWICFEHGALDWSALESKIHIAKARDVDMLVRVPRGSYSDYVRPLELDAAGLMVPHVMSAEDAAKVVEMTRFHPIGRRPADSGNADGLYCQIPFADYIEQANRERFIALQIEDFEAMDELEDICAVEGFDIIFFGPGDYSQSIGAPGELNHPKVVEARKKVVEVARKHGKFAATTATLDNFEEYLGMGYTFLNIGADVVSLSQACANNVARFRNIETAKVAGNYS